MAVVGRRAGRIGVMAGVAGRNVAAVMRPQTARRAPKRRKMWPPKPPRGVSAQNVARVPKPRKAAMRPGGIVRPGGTVMRSQANSPCVKPPCVTCRPVSVRRRARIAIIATATAGMTSARPCRGSVIWCRPSC